MGRRELRPEEIVQQPIKEQPQVLWLQKVSGPPLHIHLAGALHSEVLCI